MHSERVLMLERERLNAILAELNGKLKEANIMKDSSVQYVNGKVVVM